MSYAHPETLVSLDWAEAHRGDENVRLVEVDVDTMSYEEGHVPGAIAWNWQTQLCDVVQRDILSKEEFEALMRASGIRPDTTVVLYGDNNNWFAAWAFWQMKIYGHADVRMMNGGRKAWLANGKPLSLDDSEYPATDYTVGEVDASLRALLPEVHAHVQEGLRLVDVRSPAEYTGALLAPPGLPETCQRGGHIPGAANIPWGKVCAEDGTFKSREEIAAIYAAEGITGDAPIIAYCRIGERSSHSWFALKYLLGYENVRNYDGSWTEWGNLVGVAIEK